MKTALLEEALKDKLHVLLVDDKATDRSLVRASLREGSSQLYDFIEYDNAADALTYLKAQNKLPDCMMLDMHMPGMSGLEAIRSLNAEWGHMPLPVVVLTGSSGSETTDREEAAQALAMGAQDYLSKSSLHNGMLNGVILNALERFKLINENKLILTNLNDQEEQYRLATEAANMGTWVLTADNRFKCSSHCKKLHGVRGKGEFFTPEEFLRHVHEKDAAKLNAKLQEIIQGNGGRDFKIDYRIRQSDGSYRWANAKGRAYRQGDEAPRLVGTVQDITAQKEVGDILRASEARLRQLADTMPHMVWITLPDGRHEYFNQRWYEFTGAPEKAAKDDRRGATIHPEDLGRAREKWDRSLQSGDPYEVEYRLRHRSGEYRWVLARAMPVHDENGLVKRWYGTCTEIHSQLEREQFIRRMLESSPDCIEVLDLNGNLLTVNETGMKQMEIDDLSQWVNKPWIDFWTVEERARAVQALARAKAGETVAFEGVCQTVKGTQRWWEVVLTPLVGPTGETEKLLSISRDISERKKIENTLIETLKAAEEARQKAEAANVAKSEFLANMSHEIRTPMNAVIGLSNILARSSPLTERQKECIRTLQLSADSLLTLINDLLDISKIETRTVELESIAFDLRRMMQEVISVMSVRAREKNLRFMLNDLCPPHAIYMGDQARLRQVLLNLCSNAIKFTDQGSVDITISAEPLGDTAGDRITIACVDTGIGIPANKIDSIFQKFVQADSSINRKYGGSGLGLAITKTLVEIMGGTIAVESKLGEGSVFTVQLPLQRAQQEDDSMTQESKPVEKQSSGACILLVEDYPANVLVASMFLEQFGYSYDVASNGQEAVEKVKTGKPYVAILMDVQMHGMNGFEATRHIRHYEKEKNLRPTPIIGMTAHALAGDRERCIGVGMDDYISKPFNPDELYAKLRACNEQNVSRIG